MPRSIRRRNSPPRDITLQPSYPRRHHILDLLLYYAYLLLYNPHMLTNLIRITMVTITNNGLAPYALGVYLWANQHYLYSGYITSCDQSLVSASLTSDTAWRLRML